MLANIAIIIIISLLFAYIFKKMQLPELLGMVIVGVLLGPYSKEFFQDIIPSKLSNIFFISDNLLNISSELRMIALIVILIRAGLGINKRSLKKVGIIVIRIGSIPIIIEAIFLIIASKLILGLDFIESAILAFTIAAVSPAIIVPGMIDLKEKKLGEKKAIPTMLLAGASIDVIFAITFFGIFLELGNNRGGQTITLLLSIPISIVSGIIIGVLTGRFLVYYFKKKRNIRDTKKVLIFIAIAVLFNHLEQIDIFPVASLIGIISIGYVVLDKYDILAKRLALKFSKVWVIAEIILFVLIGSALDISQLSEIGLSAIIIIIIGLCGRSIGVYLSLLKTKLTNRERVFCMMAFIPKATVQAALGAIPLSMGIHSGETILAIAVLSIVIAAPIGSILIKTFASNLLTRDLKEGSNKIRK